MYPVSGRIFRFRLEPNTVGSKKDPVEKNTGGKRIVVSRSVQRLTLVLPVEEQTRSLQVVNNDVIEIQA